METIESKQINDWLETQAKKPPGFKSGPLFRLAWSTDQWELRRGTFCLYNGETLVREVKSTERVKKYPYFIDRWVFEQWYPPELVMSPNLPESINGSYEPLYVFEGIDGNPLALRLDVIQFLVGRVQNKPKSSPELIRSTIAEDLANKEEKQFEFDMEYLECSAMQSNLHHGEGIVVPHNYHVNSPNLRSKQ